jgi:predicted NACHT family NTPase
VAAAVRELGQRAPGCLIVATSRITGYTEAPLPGPHWELAPFSNDAIERFVIAWCELYARELHGATGAARGRQEGQRLAQDIRSNPQVRALAKNPLLLTVLAIVHRAGVRLPDHRVELYSHATQVLVERWNQVRSMAGTGAVIPIKTSDAVRLLGPVALEMVRTGTRGAIPEDSLRRSLDRTLESGRLRTLTSADEAIQLFQHSLGLLVEQGPGTYAFMHLTLAEYFAARELVRGNEFEKLAGDPKAAFSAEWREIILLAAGELGVIRADDTRLEHLVDTLIDSAGRRRGKPSPVVPSLLAGLLADDPSLSQRSARAIIDTLIPTWWFEQDYGRIETLVAVMADSASLRRRILQGRFKSMIEEVSDTMFENLNKAIERYPDGESRQRRNE